ncbi:hypothetical protein DMN50_15670, partial [Priestia megaterium]
DRFMNCITTNTKHITTKTNNNIFFADKDNELCLLTPLCISCCTQEIIHDKGLEIGINSIKIVKI